MGIAESEAQNIIYQRELWRRGKLDDAKFSKELKASSVLNRWFVGKIMLEALTLQKNGGNVVKKLHRQNYGDDTLAIDIGGDPEVDKVKCPCHDNLITRAECLDYSGAHHDDCGGCEIGKATKDKLLPAE